MQSGYLRRLKKYLDGGDGDWWIWACFACGTEARMGWGANELLWQDNAEGAEDFRISEKTNCYPEAEKNRRETKWWDAFADATRIILFSKSLSIPDINSNLITQPYPLFLFGNFIPWLNQFQKRAYRSNWNPLPLKFNKFCANRKLPSLNKKNPFMVVTRTFALSMRTAESAQSDAADWS